MAPRSSTPSKKVRAPSTAANGRQRLVFAALPTFQSSLFYLFLSLSPFLFLSQVKRKANVPSTPVDYPDGLILRGKVDKHLQQQYTARKDETGQNKKKFPLPHLCRDRTEIDWDPTVNVYDSDTRQWYNELMIHCSVSHQPRVPTKTKTGRGGASGKRVTFNRTRHIVIPEPVKRGRVFFEFKVDGVLKLVSLAFGCKQPSTTGGTDIYFLIVDPDEHDEPMGEAHYTDMADEHVVMANEYALEAAKCASFADKYTEMANEHGPISEVHFAMAKDYTNTSNEYTVLAEGHVAMHHNASHVADTSFNALHGNFAQAAHNNPATDFDQSVDVANDSVIHSPPPMPDSINWDDTITDFELNGNAMDAPPTNALDDAMAMDEEPDCIPLSYQHLFNDVVDNGLSNLELDHFLDSVSDELDHFLDSVYP
jgi:hypothetical protein